MPRPALQRRGRPALLHTQQKQGDGGSVPTPRREARVILRPFPFLAVALLAPVLLAAEPHPWRPPFGLDRVGSAAKPFEAAAEATPDEILNPVDLGAILPPADW